MRGKWKNGDVALVTSGDVKRDDPQACAEFETVIGVRTGKSYGPGGWNQADGHWVDDAYVYEVRPLVVIDPEDREQVERLARGIYPHAPKPIVDDFAVALREFANPTPPKPEEPTGLGAVVEDEAGRQWIRHGSGPAAWMLAGASPSNRDTYAWATVYAVRVLSDGVQA